MMHLSSRFFFILLVFFLFQQVFGQVVFRKIPDYKIRTTDNLFFDITETRSIIPLNGTWSVYPANDEEAPKVTVGIPSVFEGTGDFIFERNFKLTPTQVSNNTFKLFILGLNYTADISINDIIIYRHSGGEYPIEVDLPRDILKYDSDNLISIKLVYELNSENTIPLKQRFLFPQNFGGISSDIYIHLKPNISFVKETVKSSLNLKKKEAVIEVTSVIRNNEFKELPDSLVNNDEFHFRVSVIDQLGQVVKQSQDLKINLSRNGEEKITQSIKIEKPQTWSSESPNSYLVSSELRRGEQLIDVTYTSVSLYTFSVTNDSLMLNGSLVQLKGVTYFPSNTIYGKMVPYDLMEKDIALIKETGFNSVRFAKSVPHPYYLRLCEQYGLLAFIELPVGGVPAGIAQNQNFYLRCKEFVSNYISYYGKYSSVVGIGLGTSYFTELESHISLLSSLSGFIKENSDFVTYASFASTSITKVENLDMYGVELFDKKISSVDNEIKILQNDLGSARVIISETTYPVSTGNTDGYVNDYSYEAQAKYFEDLLDYSGNEKLSGYFINTFIDYRGDYSSLVSGYNPFNLYNIGLIGEDRSTNRLPYKVVYAKMHNMERVTIPIGSKKDDAPMIFIVFGLFLALVMGGLVNSGKKFREDATRALIRPYNFFADVRDQRIISAFHTSILGLIISAVSALIVANILFYLKSDILFERTLLSFGNVRLMGAVNYLAWHPILSLLWIALAGIFVILVISILIKTVSLFARTRVYIASSYFTVIWSHLPFVLLIPVGIVLYRLL
ncbi:MAG TPA: glycoside hydrolase family 2 TIM barrel-domain containing protein, partial [Ignavibacteriaceae bacterium]